MVRKGIHPEETEAAADRKALVRDLVVAVVVVGGFFGGLLAYTQTYPPIVVVESESMQHADTESYVGVIDTGDLVFVQAARQRRDVVTWIEGKVTGHATYGDFGDVIVFRKPGFASDSTPVIHRAIMHVRPNATDPLAYDIPDLLPPFPRTLWEGVAAGGVPVQSPFGLHSVTIHRMGWRGDLGITFELSSFAQSSAGAGVEGYLTMGDNNAYDRCSVDPDPCQPLRPYDLFGVVPQGNVLGRARGEIPWFGLLKLTYEPTGTKIAGSVIGVVAAFVLLRKEGDVILVTAILVFAIVGYIAFSYLEPGRPIGTGCCSGWGDTYAPANSWTSLAIALPLVFGSPFLVEAAVWAWGRYIAPRIRRRRAAGVDAPTDPPER
ncbi:MAG: S26 family signal peptidase [Methanobacteriota archaeon]